MYLETVRDGRHKKVLYPTPALSLVSDIGFGNPMRGNGIEFSGSAYWVAGSKLMTMNAKLVVSQVGSLSSISGFVTMAENGSQLMIVDGKNGYIWDNTTLVNIIDADYPAGNYITFMDGYFIIEDPLNIGRFVISNLYDGLSWGTLDFARAESNPDDMFVPYSLKNQLLLFGLDSIESYFNSGNADFPFDPQRNSVMHWGIHAKNSLIQADNTLFWIGRNREGQGQILKMRSGNPEIISNRDIDNLIHNLTDSSDCLGMSYQQQGHTFVIFTFPTDDVTIVYDTSENAWHRRKSFGIGRHRMHGHVFFQGMNLVGDYENQHIYELDLNKYDDVGQPIERIRQAQYVHNNNKGFSIFELEIEVEYGVGLTTGQGSDPQIMLRTTKDGSHEWSFQRFGSMGKKGKYATRIRWNKLGKCKYQFSYEVKVTDPVFVCFIAAYMRFEELDH